MAPAPALALQCTPSNARTGTLVAKPPHGTSLMLSCDASGLGGAVSGMADSVYAATSAGGCSGTVGCHQATQAKPEAPHSQNTDCHPRFPIRGGATTRAVTMPTGPPVNARDRLLDRFACGTHLRTGGAMLSQRTSVVRR